MSVDARTTLFNGYLSAGSARNGTCLACRCRGNNPDVLTDEVLISPRRQIEGDLPVHATPRRGCFRHDHCFTSSPRVCMLVERLNFEGEEGSSI